MLNAWLCVRYKFLYYYYAIQILTYIFNFWHSGTLALRDERQSARMSEIKNVG